MLLDLFNDFSTDNHQLQVEFKSLAMKKLRLEPIKEVDNESFEENTTDSVLETNHKVVNATYPTGLDYIEGADDHGIDCVE